MITDAEFWAAYDDPRWEARRLTVLAVAEYRCFACGAAGYWCADCERRSPGRDACDACGRPADALQAHHRHYVAGRMPWEYSDSELCCLCVPCHERVTVLIRRGRAALERLGRTPDVAAGDRAAVERLRTRLGWLDLPDLVAAVTRLERMHSPRAGGL